MDGVHGATGGWLMGDGPTSLAARVKVALRPKETKKQGKERKESCPSISAAIKS